MKNKNYKKWHKKQEFENLTYLGQRLDELFFDYTLDTYKPPALNAIFLCREAIALIDDIENEIIDGANLKYVLDELIWSLSSDIVAKLILNAPAEKFVLCGDSVKLSETKIRLEVLERTLNPYEYVEICEDLLRAEVGGGSKKKIDEVCRIYACTLINLGLSKQYIYEQIQSFFFYGNEISSIDELEEFFEKVSITTHHYEIYFVVSDLIVELGESFDRFGISVIRELPEAIRPIALEKGLIPLDNEVWVEIEEIEAFDRHSARQKAEARMGVFRDLVLLFSHKNKIVWRDDSIITQCCDEQPIIIRAPKNSMEKCFDLKASDASKRLNSMVTYIGLEGDSFSKFSRVVDLHAISTTNDLPENQLLNVWIALETLIPSHVHGGGKINKINNGLMPILLKRYLSRIIERVSADLVRWSRSKTSKILRDIKDSKNKGLYQKVLELIALEENSSLLKKLYSELDNFYLLRNRVFELNKLFSSPENVLKKIELHEKKATWQLRRIYRTRNLIVHSGKTIPYIHTLIENAHDYLDQAISEVLNYTCGDLDATTLEQVFDMAKLDYEVLLKEIRTIDSFNAETVSILL